MLENSWSNKLRQQPKLSTIVNIPNPTIIYQTQSNQLIAHSQSQTSTLPIRKDILSLSSLPNGQILLLSRYQLSCFDLINNNQLFNLQFENAGKLYVRNDCIYVVCGCDLFCYNTNGEELYVNHFSALIEALTVIQIKQSFEVVIGLNDLTMARYKGVNITFDYGKVVGIPIAIASISSGVLVGTQQGTVAYYQSKKSKWKAKSSHPVLDIQVYQTQTDYMAIIARKDGLLQLKDWKNKGETISKIKLNEDVIGIFIHDFRQDDNRQIVCILKSGTIKGVNIYQDAKKVENKKIAGDQVIQDMNFQALQSKKLNLQFEISQLKEQLSKAGTQNSQQVDDGAILSKDFNFSTYIHHTDNGFTLQVTSTDGYISGLCFQQPILPVQYDRQTHIKYNFKAQNVVFGQINCQVLVHSSYTTKTYEVRAFKITLPKFWKFNRVLEAKHSISSGMKFSFVQRNARYIKWLSQGFYIAWNQQEKSKIQTQNPLKLRFTNEYEKIDLQFIFSQKDGKVQILCDDLKTLGNIAQDFVEYVGAKEMDSELWFPNEKEKLKETLSTIEKLSQAKVSISSEMAEAIENIKFLLVKGESARCVGSMKDLRRTYSDVMGYNRNLLVQIQKKNLNTKQLSQSLKTLGQFINQTASVRYGKAKEQVISACREAIKKKEFPKILTIMERGLSGV